MKNRLRLVRVVPGQPSGYTTFTFTQLANPTLKFAELKVGRNDSGLSFEGNSFALDPQMHEQVREYQQILARAKGIEKLLWKFIRTAQEAVKNPRFKLEDDFIYVNDGRHDIAIVPVVDYWCAVVVDMNEGDEVLDGLKLGAELLAMCKVAVETGKVPDGFYELLSAEIAAALEAQ